MLRIFLFLFAILFSVSPASAQAPSPPGPEKDKYQSVVPEVLLLLSEDRKNMAELPEKLGRGLGATEDTSPEEQDKTIARETAPELEQAFKDLARDASVGAVPGGAVNSILGGGLSIQTRYYPEYPDPHAEPKPRWLGGVLALFVDKWGELREDSDGDGQLTFATGQPGDPGFPSGDLVVRFEPDPDGGPTRINRYYDEFGNGQWRGNLVDRADSAQKLRAVWDASRLLAEGAPDDRLILYLAESGKTKNGNTESGRLEEFKPSALAPDELDYLARMMVHYNTPALLDREPDPPPGPPAPPAYQALARELMDFIRGRDVDGWRSREVSDPWTEGGRRLTWKLGDVINSKPVIVGGPAFNYDLLYNDESYGQYKKAAAQRRQVAYFGANDGMLHAVNLGFFGSLEAGQAGYEDPAGRQMLGRERWAFIPTAVLPHLQWLADPEYNRDPDYRHVYYVDMKPLIADMRIGDPDDQYGGWRTVLLGGLRLGGREIETGVTGANPSYSEFFALDITDPENRPRLLWRYSAKELGLSVGLPAAVRAEDGGWYVVLASGPQMDLAENDESPYDGYSGQPARLIVLSAASGTDAAPDNTNLIVPQDMGSGFFNDSFLPLAVQDADSPWRHRLVYYGLTISRKQPSGDDTGALYRLHLQGVSPTTWALKRFVNTERPVTGAVNATLDSRGRQWVVFGTGRLWESRDLNPCSESMTGSVRAACDKNHIQYLYGLKEPLAGDGRTLSLADLTPVRGDTAEKLALAGAVIDVSGAKVYKSGLVTGLGGVAGLEGLAPGPGDSLGYGALAGALKDDSVLGYRRALDTGGVLGEGGNKYEMILTQPKVNGLSGGESYMAFTSYAPPSADLSGDKGDGGRSYLHVVDTYTGLPVPYMYGLFADFYPHDSAVADDGQVAGHIGAGRGRATEAAILRTDSRTRNMASGQDGGLYDLSLDSELTSRRVISWREVLDTGFTIPPEIMTKGLEP
jgi:hypothetical protein